MAPTTSRIGSTTRRSCTRSLRSWKLRRWKWRRRSFAGTADRTVRPRDPRCSRRAPGPHRTGRRRRRRAGRAPGPRRRTAACPSSSHRRDTSSMSNSGGSRTVTRADRRTNAEIRCLVSSAARFGGGIGRGHVHGVDGEERVGGVDGRLDPLRRCDRVLDGPDVETQLLRQIGERGRGRGRTCRPTPTCPLR